MKLIFRPTLFVHLLLYCATQALGVRIQSVPGVSSDGVIETGLKKTVSLVCQPDSSTDPQADEELVWLRNGAVVSLKEGNKEGSSSVCVSPVLHEDNGATFTCHLNKNATVSASVTLNVTYGPEISGSEEVTVEEEAELLLQCDIWANPPVSSLSWAVNGSQVDLIAGGFTVTSDGFKTQLSAGKVEKGLHGGSYQCSAVYNSREHTKVFYVTVTDKTIKFPLMPMIAGLVVVGLTAILAVASRWKKITKCCRK
ncbi:transmembrane and immunoglobulin domain-containing protein 1 [Symphorus nematophorus]